MVYPMTASRVRAIRRAFRQRAAAWSLVALAGLAGCSQMIPKKNRMLEQRGKALDGSKYQVIVVIAGGDARGELRQSALVRQTLQEGGYQAVRRGGRWSTEADALADICPAGETISVDGILFVYYNMLTLFDCRTRLQAYRIEGGDELGIEGMTKRLMQNLGPPKGAAQ